MLKICSGDWRATVQDVMRRFRLGAVVICLAVSAALVLSACGTPPWQADATAGPTSGSAASASATAGGQTGRPTSVGTAASVGGDLAAGATTRTLRAGDLVLTVRYWSTLPMDEWTAGADKPLSIAVSSTSASGSGARLASASVDTTFRTESGTDVPELDRPARQTSDSGWAVTAPASWSGTFLLGRTEERSLSLRVLVTLVFSEGSGAAATQQTATDIIRVDLAR